MNRRLVDDSHLFGRASELERVRVLAGRLPLGRGSAVVLTGEHGIGKTSLLEEAITVCGQVAPDSRTVHVPSGLLSGPNLSRLGTAMLQAAPLASPETFRLIEGAPREGHPAEFADWELIGQAADVISQATSERPLLVAFDDAPLDDPKLFAAFTSLVTRLTAVPVMFLVTAARLPTLVGSSPLGSPLWIHRLGRLGLQYAADLALHRGGPEMPPSVAYMLARRSGGNPGDLLELCTELSCDELRGLDLPRRFLPGTRTSARNYEQWWNDLEPDSREQILTAAVTTERHSAVLGHAVHSTGRALTGPFGDWVLHRTATGVAFDDQRLPSAVLALTPAEELRRLHARIAQELSESDPSHHWHLIGAGRARPEAVAVVTNRAWGALEDGDLDLARQVAEYIPAELVDASEVRDLHFLRGLIALHLGCPARAVDELAAAIGIGCGNLRKVAPLVLALDQRDGAVPGDVVDHALATLADDGTPGDRVSLACLAARLHMKHEEHVQAADYLERAEACAGEVPQDDEFARWQSELAVTRSIVRNVPLASEDIHPELSSRLMSPAMSDALTWELELSRVAWLVRTEPWQRGRSGLDALSFQLRHVRTPGWLRAAWMLLSVELDLTRWNLHHADVDRIRVAAHEPLHVCAGGGAARMSYLCALRGDDVEADHWGRLAHHLIQYRPAGLGDLRDLEAMKGRAALIASDFQAAIHHLTDAVRLDKRIVLHDPFLSLDLALARLATGDCMPPPPPPESFGNYEQAVELRTVLEVLWTAGRETLLGAADLIGEIPSAGHRAKLFELAAARLRPYCPEGGETGENERLLDTDSPAGVANVNPDPLAAEAVRQFTSFAQQEYDSCGAVALAQRLSPAPKPRALGKFQLPISQRLTREERRITAMVYDGATNKDIARELFVSVRTVELRLTTIYRKLGVRSRGKLRNLPEVQELIESRNLN